MNPVKSSQLGPDKSGLFNKGEFVKKNSNIFIAKYHCFSRKLAKSANCRLLLHNLPVKRFLERFLHFKTCLINRIYILYSIFNLVKEISS